MIDISDEYNFLNGAWHLSYYISQNRPVGSLADNILKFKDNHPIYVNCWSAWARDELFNLGIHFDFIIRALGSTELTPSGNKSLDLMGAYLANNLKSHYCPEVLMKKRLTPPMHTLRTRVERNDAIHDSYCVSRTNYNFNNKNILILDDVTTSRTTIKEILRALKIVWPKGKYYFFCLGRTNYNLNANDKITMRYFR